MNGVSVACIFEWHGMCFRVDSEPFKSIPQCKCSCHGAPEESVAPDRHPVT